MTTMTTAVEAEAAPAARREATLLSLLWRDAGWVHVRAGASLALLRAARDGMPEGDPAIDMVDEAIGHIEQIAALSLR